MSKFRAEYARYETGERAAKAVAATIFAGLAELPCHADLPLTIEDLFTEKDKISIY